MNAAPVYKVKVPETPEEMENTGIVGMGIVIRPAIEKPFQAFQALTATDGGDSYFVPFETFKTGDNKILVGAAMIPNKPMPRIGADGQPITVVFPPEAVRYFAKQFEASPHVKRVLNFDHSDYKVSGEITNSYIQKQNDFSQVLGVDAPNESWIICAYIEDQNFYDNYVKTKIVTGFSIEIKYDLELVSGGQPPAPFNKKPKPAKVDLQFETALKNEFRAIAQFSDSETVVRQLDAGVANLALLNRKNCTEKYLAINKKLISRSKLSWDETAELVAYFSEAKLDDPTAQALGGVLTQVWIEKEFYPSFEAFRLSDKIVETINQSKYNNFMRKFKGKMKAMKNDTEIDRAYSKLTAEDGLKYYLDNTDVLMKLFKRKGLA